MTRSLCALLCLALPSAAQEPVAPGHEIVVVGTREPSEALLVPAHVTVLDADAIERSNARDVAEALSGVPGLYVWRPSSTPASTFLDTRGFNNGGGNGQRLAVLVDGRKTNGVNTSATDWASIPLENIERIEVVRGPAAALYGDTALGGVIHIITKDGAATPERHVTAEAGSFGSLRENLFLSGTEGPFSYSLFGKREESDGFRENSDFEGKDTVAKGTYDLGNSWRARAKVGVHDDDRRLPGTLTKDEIARLGPDASVTPDNRSNVFASDGDIGIERISEVPMKGAGTVQERTSLFGSWTHDRQDSRITYTGAGDWSAVDDSNRLGLTLQKTEVLRLFAPDIADLKLTGGADLGRETSEANSLSDFPTWFFVEDQATRYVRRTLGLFTHAEFAATDKILLTGGVRFDRALFDYRQHTTDRLFGTETITVAKKDFDQWNPHAGVNYRWSETGSTYLSWGRSLRYPNRDELVGFLSGGSELVPERAATWEAGVRHERGDDFTGTLSVFRSDVSDEIFFVFQPLPLWGSNQNLRRVRHQGFEADARGRLAEPVTLLGNYTFTRTTPESGPFDGNDFPVPPIHQGRVGVEITPAKGLLFTAQTRIIGSRYLINDLENAHDRLPSYAVADLGVRYTHGTVQAWVSAYNVTDRDYMEAGGIRSTNVEAFSPGAGANFEAGVQVDF